jgi:hypothetical protein
MWHRTSIKLTMRFLAFKSFWTSVVLLAFSVIAVNYALSNPNGITGQSKVGCTGFGCHHATTASPSTSVRISTTAKSIEPGKQYDFRITVKNPTARQAGCDISSSGGALALSGTGSGLLLSRKELTHNTPRSFTGDSAVWNFKWTAPAASGTYIIFAAGNAVNANGTDDPGDLWNVTTDTIVVGPSVPAPKIALSVPTSVKARVGTSANVSIVLRNTGELGLDISSFKLKSGVVLQLTDTTVHAIAAHDTALITASFSPAARQLYVDSLIVTSNDPSSPRISAAIRANGTAGVLKALPAAFDFGSVKIGDTKTTRIVLRNTGDDTLTVETLTAQTSTPFAVLTILPFLTFPATFAPNDSVAVTISFQPTVVQRDSMSLLLNLREAVTSHDTVFAIYGTGAVAGSVAESGFTEIHLSPNPATNRLQISEAEQFTGYAIVDARGVVRIEKPSANQSSISIDVSGFATGMYWIRLERKNGSRYLRPFAITH